MQTEPAASSNAAALACLVGSLRLQKKSYYAHYSYFLLLSVF